MCMSTKKEKPENKIVGKANFKNGKIVKPDATEHLKEVMEKRNNNKKPKEEKPKKAKVKKTSTGGIVLDEIKRQQSNLDTKTLCFQKVEQPDKTIEYRFIYYMANTKGNGVIFGRFATFIPQDDLLAMWKEAQSRKWF